MTIRKATYVLALPFAIALTSPGCSQKIDTHLEYAELGRQHEREGRLPEAVTAYRKAIELDDSVSTTWYDLGVAYTSMEQYTDAIEAYSNAIKHEPSLALAYNNRAIAYAQLRQFDRAVEDCDAAINLQPDDFVAWRNRGLAQHDLGKLDAAIQDYDESIRLNGQVADTYRFRGNVYLELKQWKRALEDFDHAIHLDDSLAGAWVGRAEASNQLGNQSDAEQALARANELGATEDWEDLPEIQGVDSAASRPSLPDGAAEFVRQHFSSKYDLTDASSPFSFQAQIDGRQTHVLIRVLATDEPDQRLFFSAEEMSALENVGDSTLRLVVVQQAANGAAEEATAMWQITSEVPDWQPALEHREAVLWSLPVPNGD